MAQQVLKKDIECRNKFEKTIFISKIQELDTGIFIHCTVLVQYLFAVFGNLDLQLQLQYSGNPCTVTVRYNGALLSEPYSSMNSVSTKWLSTMPWDSG